MALNGETKSLFSDESICRDFLRNACSRGTNCKFKHPPPQELKKYAQEIGLPFCHDYQNRGCERPNCRYMHISREEEKEIKETGIIPPRLITETSKNVLHAADLAVLQGETPLCKDYLKGVCNRGAMCKFRHVDMDYSGVTAAATAAVTAAVTNYAQYGTAEQYYDTSGIAPPQKRTMYDEDYYNRMSAASAATAAAQSYYQQPGAAAAAADYYSRYYGRYQTGASTAEEENRLLREEVEKLKAQLTELRSQNDLLLEQNARLRVGKDQSVLSSIPGAASVASGVSSVMTPAAIAPVAHTSVAHQAYSALSQQVPLNSELAQEAALQQRYAHELNAPTAAYSQSMMPAAGDMTMAAGYLSTPQPPY